MIKKFFQPGETGWFTPMYANIIVCCILSLHHSFRVCNWDNWDTLSCSAFAGSASSSSHKKRKRRGQSHSSHRSKRAKHHEKHERHHERSARPPPPPSFTKDDLQGLSLLWAIFWKLKNLGILQQVCVNLRAHDAWPYVDLSLFLKTSLDEGDAKWRLCKCHDSTYKNL